VTEVSEEDLERLASRMAMLVSEAGEADNAGRAVAALARRVGLSGGQLKAFFLAGASESMRTGGRERLSKLPDAAEHIGHLERELSALRHGVKLTEVQARNALRERDALRLENNTLREAIDRSRSAEQVWKFLGGVVIASTMLVALVLAFGPSLRNTLAHPMPEQTLGTPFKRAGVIRPSGAMLMQAPDQQSTPIAQLMPGTRVKVRQMVWHALNQWAEVEVGDASGYVVSTSIDLP
jgi:hypothetical protein